MSFRIEDILKKSSSEKGEKRTITTESSFNNLLSNSSSSSAHEFFKGLSPHNDYRESIYKETTHSTETKRKRRVLFTREQTHELEKVFQHHQYLTVQQREYISRKIKLTSTQVKIWFQNHRYKLKKILKDLRPSHCCCSQCCPKYQDDAINYLHYENNRNMKHNVPFHAM